MLALHFVNGKYKKTITSGKYAYFKVYDKHEFKMVSIKNPEVSEDIPKYLFAHIPKHLFIKIEVADYQKARLCFDGKFVKLLESGSYYFWNNGTKSLQALWIHVLCKLKLLGKK